MKKIDWHKRNITFLRKHVFERARLPWSYLEVVDVDVPESYALLSKMLSAPTCYLAINNDPRVCMRHPRRDYQLICGDAFQVAHRLAGYARNPKALEVKGVPKPVAVFNFDLQDAVGSSRFWEERGQTLLEIVRQTHDAIGQCAILLNLALNGWTKANHDLNHEEAIKLNTRQFLERFGPEFNGLSFDALIGENLDELDEKDYSAEIASGCYDIYKRPGVSMPMATMRLFFERGKAFYGSP